MVGKYYKWQTHWSVDGTTATHDSGLVVVCQQGGGPTATPESLAIVLPTIDAANRDARMRRLLREAAEIVGAASRARV